MSLASAIGLAIWLVGMLFICSACQHGDHIREDDCE